MEDKIYADLHVAIKKEDMTLQLAQPNIYCRNMAEKKNLIWAKDFL